MKNQLRELDRMLGSAMAQLLSPGSQADSGRPLPPLADVKRVLLVRLDSIGDMVLTTPLLRELRRNLRQAEITLVVRPAVQDLVALCPYVDRVLPYADAYARPRSALLAVAHASRFRRRHWRSEAFDLALLPRWEDDAGFSSVLARMSRATRRVGYQGTARLTHAPSSGPELHEATRNLELIRLLGGTVDDDQLELWIDAADHAFATDLLAAHRVGSHDFVLAIGPGAGHPRRRWPLDRFAEVGAWSLSHNAGFVLVVGGADERAMGNELRSRLGPRVINAAGLATLRGTAALLQRSTLFVGNDSGSMHVAAGVGVPVVEVSCHPEGGAPAHPNSPIRFAPWRVPHRIARPDVAVAPCVDACASDGPHCISTVPAATVTTQVTHLLTEKVV